MKMIPDVLSRLPALLAAILAINLLEASLANAKCRNINGVIRQRAGSDPSVTATGTLSGKLPGKYNFTINSLIPGPENTSVSLFTGSATITTRQGDIFGVDAGALDSVSPGNIVDLLTITGGTGVFENASGQIQLSGNFDSARGRGTSTYKGRLCTP